MRAMIAEAISTTMALDWSSFQVGHDTLCINSLYDSSKYVLIPAISLFFFARAVRLELTTFGFGDRCSTN